MPFGTTTTATDWLVNEPWQVRLLRILLWFVPRANPDNEALYPRVRRWALEIDESGKAIREIGLGEAEVVLFRAPDRRNRGMWTDSPVTISIDHLEPMDEGLFEDLWQRTAAHDA